MKWWRERWKRKAIKRRYENKKLRKRLKELKESRDLWKNKAHNSNELISELKDELKKNNE